MQAVILAAGMGKRLKDLTKDNTKCMIKVNGVTLIERMLSMLDEHNLSRIVIVIGYKGSKLKQFISTLDIKTPVVYITNDIYDRTNNIYSLALAKDWLQKEDTLLLESDIIFERSVLDAILNDPRETLALVDKYESWMDGTCVKLSDNDTIESFVSKSGFNFTDIKDYFKTVNIYKFSSHFSRTHYVPFLEAYQKALGENEYYEQVLRVITMLDDPEIQAKRLNGEKWYEIDDIQDLDIAESIFADDDNIRVSLMQGRFGGYWRYPKLLDFCYLVNPYFPPEKLKDEIRANFDTLLGNYPSGMKVNSLLAAKNFSVRAENIIVGNGAAELIKSLMDSFHGKTGFIRPTFEEYPHRYDASDSVNFVSGKQDYLYDADDIINFFDSADISNLIIVNPDNPTGNYISHAEMMRLVQWSYRKNIRLVIDESFSDFSDELNNTFIDQEILDNYPHLFIMKSISKSYGVPGLRLGVLASGDTEMISLMKKDVAIWNINSFAEFYMQIEEKYKPDYKKALESFRRERSRFSEELSRIDGITVIPSQANFIMIRLKDSISPKELLKTLLVRYNILIKELTTKTNGRNYLRLAVRDTQDNNALICALKKVLSGR